MKAYTILTGIIFGLITLAHIWRVVVEQPALAKDPGFIILTALTAALCIWAISLLRRWPKG